MQIDSLSVKGTREQIPGSRLKWLSEYKHTLAFPPKVENAALDRQDFALDPKYA